jgi:hypothetical protein
MASIYFTQQAIGRWRITPPSDRRLRVSVINFWPTAFKNDFFDYLLGVATEKNHVYVSDPDQADLVISSVFGNTRSHPEKTVLYIGENIRPSFSRCAYSLSFDQDSWQNRNYYLPLWYSRLAWPGYTYVNERNDGVNTHGYEALIPLESLTSSRSPMPDFQQRKFCAMVAGNPEALRTNLYSFVSAYRRVEGFGKLFQRPLFQSKFNILKDYRFSLCPENSYYPGYVTEKLFDAWFGGTLPIYYGAAAADKTINRLAFLNYADDFDIAGLLQRVEMLDSNEAAYMEIYTQPLLTRPPSLDGVILFLRKAIEAVLAKRFKPGVWRC